MKVTKFGHACLLIEEGKGRILMDPGVFSEGYEDLKDLDAVLITHEHQDHLMPEELAAVMANNPGAKLYADEDSVAKLGTTGIKAQVVHEGDEFEAGGVKVAVIGSAHAEIHPDLPGVTNVGYLVAGRLFYPGDALTVPKVAVEILAAPSVAPWMSVAEAVDYVRAVKPKVAIPVHDGITTAPGMYANLIAGLTKEQGVRVQVLENGRPTEI